MPMNDMMAMIIDWLFLFYVIFYFYSLLILLFFVIVYFFEEDYIVICWFFMFLFPGPRFKSFRYKVIIANVIIFIVIALFTYFFVPYYNLVAFAIEFNFHAIWLIWAIILLFIKKYS